MRILKPILLLIPLGLSGAVWAQEQPMPPPRRDPPRILPRPDLDQPMPPRTTPRPEGQRPVPPKAAQTKQPPAKPALPTEPKARLEALFSRLHEAQTPAEARQTEKEIERMLERSGSATADLTFARASQALAGRDFETALDLLDYTIALGPHFAEGFHRRAQVHLMRKDEEAALRDLRMTLALEPRHFMALATFAGILRSSGDRKGAYKALLRLKELNPHFPEIGEVLEKLRPEVEGQKI